MVIHPTPSRAKHFALCNSCSAALRLLIENVIRYPRLAPWATDFSPASRALGYRIRKRGQYHPRKRMDPTDWSATVPVASFITLVQARTLALSYFQTQQSCFLHSQESFPDDAEFIQSDADWFQRDAERFFSYPETFQSHFVNLLSRFVNLHRHVVNFPRCFVSFQNRLC